MNDLLLLLLLPWEVFLDGSSLWRVESYCGKKPSLSFVFILFQQQNKFMIQFPVRHGHCSWLLADKKKKQAEN